MMNIQNKTVLTRAEAQIGYYSQAEVQVGPGFCLWVWQTLHQLTDAAQALSRTFSSDPVWPKKWPAVWLLRSSGHPLSRCSWSAGHSGSGTHPPQMSAEQHLPPSMVISIEQQTLCWRRSNRSSMTSFRDRQLHGGDYFTMYACTHQNTM